MKVIPHQDNNRFANDDVILTGDVNSSAAPQKSSMRLPEAPQREDQCTRSSPDDSWIAVKREVESEQIVRVIPHKADKIDAPHASSMSKESALLPKHLETIEKARRAGQIR